MFKGLVGKVNAKANEYYFGRVECSYPPLDDSPSGNCPSPDITYPSKGQCWFRSCSQMGGELISNDKKTTSSAAMRIVSLNMEMGRQLGAVIDQLSALKPDVVCLQEVDIGVPRTKYTDQVAILACTLGMHALFACEVTDPSVLPSQRENDGTIKSDTPSHLRGGVQGSAILSRYQFLANHCVHVPCQRHEPRKSRHERYKWHTYPVALLRTSLGEHVQVSSVHLDAHIGGFGLLDKHPHEIAAIGRRTMFCQLYQAMLSLHMTQIPSSTTPNTDQEEQSEENCTETQQHNVFEDEEKNDHLNALCGSDAKHVVINTANMYSHDESFTEQQLRNESQQQSSPPRSYIQSVHHMVIAGDFNTVKQCSTKQRWFGKQDGSFHEPSWFNEHAINLLNKQTVPSWTLTDPFDKHTDITLSAGFGWYQKKLDWILLSQNLVPVKQQVGHEYSQICSDHYWILVDVKSENRNKCKSEELLGST